MTLADWPRGPLSPEDVVRIREHQFAVLTVDQVVRVAQAWNGGMDTEPMARELGLRSASLRMLLGRLTQFGVTLRPSQQRARALARDPRVGAAPAITLGGGPPPSLAALRLAEFDPCVRHALELRAMGISL